MPTIGSRCGGLLIIVYFAGRSHPLSYGPVAGSVLRHHIPVCNCSELESDLFLIPRYPAISPDGWKTNDAGRNTFLHDRRISARWYIKDNYRLFERLLWLQEYALI